MERRRSSRPAFRRGRRRSRARTRRALRREAPGPGAHRRGGGGRRSVGAHPFPATGCGRARRILRVPRLRDLARGPCRSRRLVRSRRERPKGAPLAAGRLRRRSSRVFGRPPRAHGRSSHTLPGDGPAPSATPPRHRPRRGAPARLGRIRELGPGPAFRQTDEGRLLGHVHLGLRMIEERGRDLDPAVLAELLHAVACHHDRPAARTAEAAVLYHANQLDAQAATRPVGD